MASRYDVAFSANETEAEFTNLREACAYCRKVVAGLSRGDSGRVVARRLIGLPSDPSSYYADRIEVYSARRTERGTVQVSR